MRITRADYTGTPIPADRAWRIFGDWKSGGREIGATFYGCSGTNILTMGFVESMRNGSLLLKSNTAGASFNRPRPVIAEVKTSTQRR
jgi:hypothetical protein